VENLPVVSARSDTRRHRADPEGKRPWLDNSTLLEPGHRIEDATELAEGSTPRRILTSSSRLGHNGVNLSTARSQTSTQRRGRGGRAVVVSPRFDAKDFEREKSCKSRPSSKAWTGPWIATRVSAASDGGAILRNPADGTVETSMRSAR